MAKNCSKKTLDKLIKRVVFLKVVSYLQIQGELLILLLITVDQFFSEIKTVAADHSLVCCWNVSLWNTLRGQAGQLQHICDQRCERGSHHLHNSGLHVNLQQGKQT